MKTSRYTDAQSIAIKRQAEGGVPVAELCRKHGMNNALFHKWRAKYGGMDAAMVSQMNAMDRAIGTPLMEWMAPAPGVAMRHSGDIESPRAKEPSMGEIITIGLDLAKSVFQVHAVDEAGRVVLRRQIKRAQLLAFFADLSPCLVGMEACSGAHFWARELGKLGHDARLMPPSYVKPYVKRGKTDAADAEAICEAVARPNMRFVPVKTEEQQSVLMMHRARDFLVRQLTQVSNALRAHLGEFGFVVPKGVQNIERLLTLAEAGNLPANALNSIRLLAEQFRDTKVKIEDVTAEISSASDTDSTARRLKTIPGIGPITSSVLAATLPDASGFKTARDLAAWLGLTPKPHSSGGKERLGKISKMGNRYIRRLLYLGAMGVIAARRRRPAGDDWLWQLLERKPVKLVAIALASRNARTVWALLKSGESYQVARA